MSAKGALIQFMETVLVPLPNVIVFQFNPETITHSWTPAEKAAPPELSKNGAAPPTPPPNNPLAVSGSPGQSFSFTLQLDANDEIATGNAVSGAIARATGIYSRLAALETLLFPVAQDGGGLLGLASRRTVGSAKATLQQLPVVLFIWGPGRILPVRVTGLTVTEKLYDAWLNPTFAEAQVQLSVLTPEDLALIEGTLGQVARAASTYMDVARQALAVANLANAAESIIGMIPV